MPETLLSVGLDVGTTTTQMVVSRLSVENRASSFAVPDMEITQRQILYRGQVHFTPLLRGELVDGAGIRAIVEKEYERAGITRQQVDTGAVIITGETSRKENAGTVLEALSDIAGDFVVATAGPDLESVLAAKGAGAVDYSARTGKRVLHMDIGGGTSNLALIDSGKILRTGCLNVGGRLIKRDQAGVITYVSPVLTGLWDLQTGEKPAPEQLEAVAQQLTQALEMAAGLRTRTALLDALLTRETAAGWEVPEPGAVISFSGGVADCIQKNVQEDFGDIGPLLGKKIRQSRLCQGAYILGQETIRATVIGAGCHSAQLSGSTVFCRGVQLPMKNLPVAVFDAKEQAQTDLGEQIRQRLARSDAENTVLFIPGYPSADYAQVKRLAKAILDGTGGRPVLVCLEADMAKALGTAICLQGHPELPCLCIDRLHLDSDSYLDIGLPVGPCLPVVIKTLVLERKTQ